MGSSHVKGYDFARALLAEMEQESRKSIARSGEIDVLALTEILEDGLDNLAHRQALLTYLTAYLSRCVTGSVPDYRQWEPPLQ